MEAIEYVLSIGEKSLQAFKQERNRSFLGLKASLFPCVSAKATFLNIVSFRSPLWASLLGSQSNDPLALGGTSRWQRRSRTSRLTEENLSPWLNAWHRVQKVSLPISVKPIPYIFSGTRASTTRAFLNVGAKLGLKQLRAPARTFTKHFYKSPSLI